MDISDTAYPHNTDYNIKKVVKKAAQFSRKQIALALEYASLSFRRDLSEADANRLGNILKVSLNDPKSSILLTEIDYLVNEKLCLLDDLSYQSYQSQSKYIKEYIEKKLYLNSKANCSHTEILKDYYSLSVQPSLNSNEAERIGDILCMAEQDSSLGLLLNELDHVVLRDLNLVDKEKSQLFENQKSRIREFIEPAPELEQLEPSPEAGRCSETLMNAKTIDEYVLAADSWSSYSNRPISVDESWIYQHLQNCVNKEPAFMVLDRFYQLFINATGYSDRQVWQALVRTAESLGANGEFKFVLNRCCYILINTWQMQTRTHDAIAKLVGLFDKIPVYHGQSPSARCIRKLVKEFKKTDQYTALQRLSQILYSSGSSIDEMDRPLGSLIQRYPYLYEHNLLTKDSNIDQKAYVQNLKTKAEKKFSEELALYNYYRVSQEKFRPAKNPTLLSDPKLDRALEYYTGKVNEFGNHKDIARSFSAYSKEISSYREFKNVFYEYLIHPVVSENSKYAKGIFGRQFHRRIQGIFPDLNNRNLSDALVAGTCRDILNYLIAESYTRPQYHTFCDLLSNVGYQVTIGMLLRIVLFCRSVKPWLEKRFSILFNLHEDSQGKEILWLVHTLEHTNVALSANFGNLLVTPNHSSLYS